MSDVTLRFLIFGEDKGAAKTTEEVASRGERAARKMSGAFSRLGGAIGGELGDLLDKVGAGIDSVADSGGRLGTKLAVGGAGLLGLGTLMQSVGSANVAAEKALQTAIENTGGSLEDYKDQIDQVVAANQRFGTGDDETKNALASLVQLTGDAGKSLRYMGLASDLAASKHMSLQGATDLIGRAINGNNKIFKQYGIDAPKSAADVDRALSELAAKLNGSAAAASDNFNGKIKALKTTLGDTAADISAKWGPAVQVAGTVALVAGTAIEILAARKSAAAVASAAAAAATTAQTAAEVAGTAAKGAGTAATVVGTAATTGSTLATKAAAAGQWLLNAALSANPIGLVVIALLALVAGLVYAYKHSETFRRVVKAGLEVVKAGFSILWEVAKPVLRQMVNNLKILGAALGWLWKHALRPLVSAWITGFAAMLKMMAAAARAVGLTTLAKKLDNAADKAMKLRNAINNIPSNKKISIDYYIRQHGMTPQAARNAQMGTDLRRARGGDANAGRAHTVGEEGEEIYTPFVSGRIIPHHLMATQLGSAASYMGRSRSPRVSAAGRGLGRVDVHVVTETIVKDQNGRELTRTLREHKRTLGVASLGL